MNKKQLTFTIALLGVVVNSTIFAQQGCNTDTPGWGSSLGTVTRGTKEWTISGNGVHQIWSDAVTATACNKTVFSGENTAGFSADCRSNPDFPGDLFSWCAVVRFADSLCPAPWRVPTSRDFVALDMALGGDGDGNGRGLHDRYFNSWGASRGGECGVQGGLQNQRSIAYYWSQSEFDVTNGFVLSVIPFGSIQPQHWRSKHNGFTLRCVRGNTHSFL